MTLLTPKETAARLSISTRHLLDLTEDGEIPYVDISRKSRPNRRYTEEDVAGFIERRRRTECPSTKDLTKHLTPMTSFYEVVDFQATRAKLLSGKQKPSKQA